MAECRHSFVTDGATAKTVVKNQSKDLQQARRKFQKVESFHSSAVRRSGTKC